MMTLTQILAGTTIGVIFGAMLSEIFKKFILSIPGVIIQWVLKHTSLKVTIKSTDELFNLTAEWLSKQPYTEKARNVRMVYSVSKKEFIYVPGTGRHVIWYQKRPVLIEHVVAGAKPGINPWATPIDDEVYNITIFSRAPNRLKSLMQEIIDVRKGNDETRRTTTSIATWRGHFWQYLTPRRKREMNTVYMDDGLREEMIKDISWFLANEKWYITRGIPYRRGYLFYGPPGTGKTTFATALAGHFDRPICIINLTTIGGDDNLMNSFANAPHHAIILIEDVDTFTVSNQRTIQAPATPAEKTPDAQKQQQPSGVTLAGLLNAIDGVAASEGRMLILTTNHYEKLDQALIRSGRIDKKTLIGPLTASAVEYMFCNFFPDHQDHKNIIYDWALCSIEQPCASWQEIFMKYQEDPEGLLRHARENTLGKAA